jgi:hypothetical protein
MRHVPSVAAVLTLLGLSLPSPVAQAVVQTVDATVQSRVFQFLPDGAVNSDSAFESLDESTSNLPLIADATLRQTDSVSTLSGAAAKSMFSDPRASDAPDPDEFAFDVVAFSLDPAINYEATGNATETRSIVFTTEEIGAENGAELKVTSHFFVDGFMFIWGDLDPLVGTTEAQMTIRVHQTRPGQERVMVMEATLSLGLNSDGTPLVAAGGALSSDNVGFLDTLGSIILLGDAYLVALPALSIPYTYSAAVGETFTLEADVECRVRNQPYTGAAVGVGLPLDQFLGTVAEMVSEPLSASEILARTNGEVPTPIRPLSSGKGTQVQVVGPPGSLLFARGLPCGGLGIESVLFVAAFPAFFLFRCGRAA